MKIAIIGSGNVGKALARSSKRAGHTVTISAAHPDHAQSAAQETGARAAASNAEAVEDAEIVILAIPGPNLDQVVGELGEKLTGKVVVDPTNQMTPDGLSRSNAEKIQQKAPGARVVKGFNTIFATHQANPKVDGNNVDAFVAGDDAEAKRAVEQLAESMGFRPLDAGPLPMARALEGMAMLNITLNMRDGWSWQTEWKLVGPTGPTT